MDGELLLTHSRLEYRWWAVLTRGLLAIAFGILAIINPASVIVIFGVWAIITGITSLLTSVNYRDRKGGMAWHILQGIFAVAAGILVFVWPLLGVTLLILIAGIWAIVNGLMDVVLSVTLPSGARGRWLLATLGALFIVTGILLLTLKMITIETVIVLTFSILSLIYGLTLSALGIMLRSSLHEDL
jgi:uncharacterized membrane protein HdeD (DUF308 family)